VIAIAAPATVAQLTSAFESKASARLHNLSPTRAI